MDRKNRISLCCTQDNCATHKIIRCFLSVFTRNQENTSLPDMEYFGKSCPEASSETQGQLVGSIKYPW